ncbi:Uroporphyrinogen-III C-methyltransferase [Gracilaria domingensis]|nr:Uroporphyrinogen-III C-methyltransferase [Gracilaria domingensis]
MAKLPHDVATRHVLLMDPMLATGGSALMAVGKLLEAGVSERNIIFINVVAAPEALPKGSTRTSIFASPWATLVIATSVPSPTNPAERDAVVAPHKVLNSDHMHLCAIQDALLVLSRTQMRSVQQCRVLYHSASASDVPSGSAQQPQLVAAIDPSRAYSSLSYPTPVCQQLLLQTMQCFLAPVLPTRTSKQTTPNLVVRRPPSHPRHAIRASSNEPSSDYPQPGPVYLIGTGPANPDLLTQSALKKLAKADVVLYDRLVSRDLLRVASIASPTASQICVGKARGIGTGSQPAIQTLLAEYARRGKTVVRLKGGDPSIFGRVGSELAFLREQSIPVSVEPGITTASAVAASLGFPLTQKNVAQGVCFVTAHEDVDWISGSMLRHVTLVVYMGLQNLGPLMSRLRQTGAGDSVGAVAVHAATTEHQLVVWGTISSLADRVRAAALSSPTLVVIGDVVRLACGWPEELDSAITTSQQ